MNSEDLLVIVTQALEAMKEEAGDAFGIEKVNLAELGRRTGLSRSKLRTLKKKGFKIIGEWSRNKLTGYLKCND